jgi:hypothetical protein
MQRITLMWRAVLLFVLLLQSSAHGAPWQLHTIDDSSRGADGIRLGDINGDGRLDIATGWEEGGTIRVYVHPDAARVKERWPSVTVGTARSPEDAVFVDFNGDGVLDVVSSCEGEMRSAFVHFAPRDQAKLFDPSAWRTAAIAATVRQQQWMYALPLDVDGRRGLDVVIGSKGKQASIGWLESPENRRDTASWRYHRLRDAGWIMSLEAVDIDGDGDRDVLASDRKGAKRGVFWLERTNPALPPGQGRGEGVKEIGFHWRERAIGGEDHEVMFLDYADLDGDGRQEVVVAAKPRRVVVFSPPENRREHWKPQVVELTGNIGNAKAVRVTDVDLDGYADLIVSFEGATGNKLGVVWFDRAASSRWTVNDISGPPGTKFDRMELVDLDNDGDLDVITCEEAENLGVIWYENPAR